MLYELSSIRRAMSINIDLTCSYGMPPGSFVFGGGYRPANKSFCARPETRCCGPANGARDS